MCLEMSKRVAVTVDTERKTPTKLQQLPIDILVCIFKFVEFTVGDFASKVKLNQLSVTCYPIYRALTRCPIALWVYFGLRYDGYTEEEFELQALSFATRVPFISRLKICIRSVYYGRDRLYDLLARKSLVMLRLHTLEILDDNLVAHVNDSDEPSYTKRLLTFIQRFTSRSVLRNVMIHLEIFVRMPKVYSDSRSGIVTLSSRYTNEYDKLINGLGELQSGIRLNGYEIARCRRTSCNLYVLVSCNLHAVAVDCVSCWSKPYS